MTNLVKAMLACLTVAALAAIAAAPNGPAVGAGYQGLSATPSPFPPPVAEPNTFEGTVTVDGQPAPDGTLVEAVVDGVVCNSDLTDGGHYRLVVEVHRCGSPGQSVTFRVSGRTADETAVLVSPLFSRILNLTVGAAAIAPAQILGVSTGCSREFAGRAKATFMWDAGLGQSQWLDLSLLDNGFEGGTFLAAGPLPLSAEPYGLESGSFTWDDLAPNVRHFWRVNTAASGVWAPSTTASFTTPDCLSEPPGAATHLNVSRQACALDLEGTRTVTFDWEPALFFRRDPATGLEFITPGEQWLDISVLNNNFAPGTFLGIRVPDDADYRAFDVRGIRGTARHYWRINTLGPDGWKPSITQYLDAIQCPGDTG
jgi:hypothetical protein